MKALIEHEAFCAAERVHPALTATLEKRALVWIAKRLPEWVHPDHLTALGLAAQAGAGVCYALSGRQRMWLIAASLCLVLNWFGDSLDGTLARVRNRQRPRFGFYVDHVIDAFGAVFLMAGMAWSGLVHWNVAMAMLVAFLLLAIESYLATYTLARFHLSHGLFGPTEIRILLIAANVALLRSPVVHIAGREFLLLDMGGGIGSAAMTTILLYACAKHTAELYKQERQS